MSTNNICFGRKLSTLFTNQNLHWTHFGQPRMQTFFMRPIKTEQTVNVRADLGHLWAHRSEDMFSFSSCS